MDKNILFDTSCGSLNMGDYIICESVERELKEILKDDFLIKLATHTPVTHFYQNMKGNPLFSYCQQAKYKFFAGTNILQYHLIFRLWPNFNANIFNCKPYKNTILVGAGSAKNRPNMDPYTKMLFKKVLSKEHIHSARDESTKELIESLGFRAINTGCATMWCLTKEHCSQIPEGKGENVLFTITDYKTDPQKDKEMIQCLLDNYGKVFCWIQGADDYDYLKTITDLDRITIIGSSLDQYRQFLLETDSLDYVGTRLHAGLFAMQKKKRSIILSVDNRTEDMKETYNLVVVDRADLSGLDSLINSSFSTNINIKEENIREWKSQFKDPAGKR